MCVLCAWLSCVLSVCVCVCAAVGAGRRGRRVSRRMCSDLGDTTSRVCVGVCVCVCMLVSALGVWIGECELCTAYLMCQPPCPSLLPSPPEVDREAQKCGREGGEEGCHQGVLQLQLSGTYVCTYLRMCHSNLNSYICMYLCNLCK